MESPLKKFEGAFNRALMYEKAGRVGKAIEFLADAAAAAGMQYMIEFTSAEYDKDLKGEREAVESHALRMSLVYEDLRRLLKQGS